MLVLLLPVLGAVAAPGVVEVANDGGGGVEPVAAGLEINGGGVLAFFAPEDLPSSINVGVPPLGSTSIA